MCVLPCVFRFARAHTHTCVGTYVFIYTQKCNSPSSRDSPECMCIVHLRYTSVIVRMYACYITHTDVELNGLLIVFTSKTCPSRHQHATVMIYLEANHCFRFTAPTVVHCSIYSA